jgi:hypothetical protein
MGRARFGRVGHDWEDFMSHITIDAAAAVQLKAATSPVEVRDPSGKVLGRFSPAIDWSEYELVGPDISDEEFERRLNSDEKCYTTAEVLEYLRKL